MTSSRVMRLSLVILVLAFTASLAQAQLGAVVPNWEVPSSSYTPSGDTSGLHHSRTLTDVTSPMAFVGVTPCRIVDTRGAPGTFGGPALVGGSPRNFPLPTGPCAGLPALPRAYSLNITVTNTLGPGFILIYPQGGSQPLVSTLNYLAGQTVANAAIVPAGTGGGVTVIAGVSGTDLIIDINGYYGDTLGNPSNFFTLTNNSLSYTMNLTNQSGTCGATCGLYVTVASGRAIRGDGAADGGVLGTTGSTSNGAFGVQGQSFGGTGRTFGVEGTNASTSDCSAGAFGQSGAAIPCLWVGTAGVYGTNTGTWGILGLSSGARGVQGSRTDAGGNFQSSGVLGYLGTVGVFSFNDYGGVGAKYFIEPHPTDLKKQIGYIALEGPEAGTYFRGRGRFVNGQAVIAVPEDFSLVTEGQGLTAQITPIGGMAQVGVVHMDLNSITAESSRDVEFSYLVQGVRKGYANMKPIQENVVFVPGGADERMGPYPERIRQRLVSLGIYNADGTVNMETAERMGWAQQWRDEAAKAATAAAAARAEEIGKKP